jgi:rhamnogalacturonan endolyase
MRALLFVFMCMITLSQMFSQTVSFIAADWLVEFENSAGSNLRVTKDMIEIDASAGATVWYKKKLTGNVSIAYDIVVVDSGGRNDRVSDLNTFWMASEPARETPFGRNGKFSSYDDLDLYYSGVGGHDNTTTRFRRYRHGTDKSILQEYTDKEHLLQGNKNYSVKIIVQDGRTLYSINDVQYFEFSDQGPLKEGYFAFRTTKSRQRITNLKIDNLTPELRK